ncbi:MAG: hypothetical protein KKB21_03615 [Nanoarchaeota archaeon]|nr:hypothetical protein [Nanoarchaeota archaeon]
MEFYTVQITTPDELRLFIQRSAFSWSWKKEQGTPPEMYVQELQAYAQGMREIADSANEEHLATPAEINHYRESARILSQGAAQAKKNLSQVKQISQETMRQVLSELDKALGDFQTKRKLPSLISLLDGYESSLPHRNFRRLST